MGEFIHGAPNEPTVQSENPPARGTASHSVHSRRCDERRISAWENRISKRAIAPNQSVSTQSTTKLMKWLLRESIKKGSLAGRATKEPVAHSQRDDCLQRINRNTFGQSRQLQRPSQTNCVQIQHNWSLSAISA
jgi:hypothetical protein